MVLLRNQFLSSVFFQRFSCLAIVQMIWMSFEVNKFLAFVAFSETAYFNVNIELFSFDFKWTSRARMFRFGTQISLMNHWWLFNLFLTPLTFWMNLLVMVYYLLSIFKLKWAFFTLRNVVELQKTNLLRKGFAIDNFGQKWSFFFLLNLFIDISKIELLLLNLLQSWVDFLFQIIKLDSSLHEIFLKGFNELLNLVNAHCWKKEEIMTNSRC